MRIYRVLEKGKEDIHNLGKYGQDVYDGFMVAADNLGECMDIVHEYTGDSQWPGSNGSDMYLVSPLGETYPGIEKGILFQSWSSTG
jgi:hypothetical protein